MKYLTLITFFIYPVFCGAQPSIKKADIAILSQLAIVQVSKEDLPTFELSLNAISKLAKKNSLEENYDWLTYKTAPGQYLFIAFSTGLDDLLTIDSYKNRFSQSPDSLAFKKALEKLGSCKIQFEDNYIIEMVLPWSTVNEISVSVHPHATMSVFTMRPTALRQFDQVMRKMVTLLKEVDYPYPLESNRGFLGAYGSAALVWFYDKNMTENIYEHLNKWMEQSGKRSVWNEYMSMVEDLTISRKDWQPIFQKELSY